MFQVARSPALEERHYMLKEAHGKAGIEEEMEGGRVNIQGVRELYVLAFIL